MSHAIPPRHRGHNFPDTDVLARPGFPLEETGKGGEWRFCSCASAGRTDGRSCLQYYV